jgi:uncharacterized protein
MNAAFPEIVDPWRMVQARRSFQGSMPLSAMPRLRESLAAADGVVTFDLEFGKDDLGIALLQVRADATLSLLCQRTLDVFGLPVHVETRLGLISEESEEAGLPGGYEPLLVASELRLADVIEDELILALPVVPVKPGSAPAAHSWGEPEPVQEEEEARPNPFAVLKNMKVAR